MTEPKQDTAASPNGSALSDQLGPLPQPVAWFRAPYGTLEPNPLFRVSGPQSLEWAVACYTEDQLRAAVAAERERCAKLCDVSADVHWGAWDEHADPTDQGAAMEAERLASEIRGPNVD